MARAEWLGEVEYTPEKLEELAKNYPPPGHPHYIPIEQRLKIGPYAPVEVEEEEEKPEMSTAAAAKYQALKDQIAAAKKQMEETAKGLFNEMAVEFFNENPNIVSIGWTQYTPYYCDGDPCHFRANTSYPSVTIMFEGQKITYDSDRDDVRIDGEEAKTADHYKEMFKNMKGEVTSIVSRGKTVSQNENGEITVDGVRVRTSDDYYKLFRGEEKKAAKFLETFEDEDLETMFGDHVSVTVDRWGHVETEEHEHS